MDIKKDFKHHHALKIFFYIQKPTPSTISPPSLAERKHFLNRSLIGHQHRKSINADAETGSRRHGVFEGADKIFVHRHRFFIAASGEV